LLVYKFKLNEKNNNNNNIGNSSLVA